MPTETTDDTIEVLVVEDEPDLADLYTRWLAGGYLVRTATTGEDALDQLDDDVDVIFLDRHLPDLPGDAVLAEIRAQDRPCRVAMVTAVKPDFDIIGMGFDEYLTKPVSQTMLHEAVERLSRRSNYDDQLRDYFALVSTRATLDAEKTPVERQVSLDYARLTWEIAVARNRIQAMLEDLDGEDFDVLIRTFSCPAAGHNHEKTVIGAEIELATPNGSWAT